MRVLGIGDYNDFGSLYLRLAGEGHDVRVHVREKGSRDVLAGMLNFVSSWKAQLPWIREAGADGLILFEETGHGALQDQLRREGFLVVGGSEYGDTLEADRALGQAILREAGLLTAASHAFTSFADAIAFIGAQPGRYVLKFNGGFLTSDQNYVGMRDDGVDVIAALRFHARTWEADWGVTPEFILMDHVKGVETGLGAFFNGTEFIGPVNLDWEHKRFCAGDLGELTGEMGTVVTYRGGDKLFAATLAKVAPMLRAAKHVGYVNLNTIINADGIWPLEFTMRFGYPGFAILSALMAEGCGTVLQRIAAGSAQPVATHDGYAIGVCITVPPFPYHHGYEELSKGMPVCLPADLTADEKLNLHYGGRDGRRTARHLRSDRLRDGRDRTGADHRGRPARRVRARGQGRDPERALPQGHRRFAAHRRVRGARPARLGRGHGRDGRGRHVRDVPDGRRRGHPELGPVALVAAAAALEPHQRTLRERARG